MKTFIFYIKHISMLNGWVDPIYSFLKKNGFKLVVLHNTKLNKQSAHIDKSISKDYELIDLRHTSLRAILQIFQKHKPVGMLALTFRSLFDLLINRVAQHCNVKTLYIEHGFFADSTALSFGMTDKKASLIRYTNYVRKYVFFIIFISKNILPELQIIFNAMRNNDYSKAQYDYALFYADYGFKKTNKLFKYDPGKVFFSGYPLAKNKEDLACLKNCSENSCKKNKILFVSQPMILDKLSNISYEEEAQYLKEIANICIKEEYELIFQVHPRDSLERYIDVFKESDVTVIQNSSIEKSIAESTIVIGHFSTALLASIYFKKPLLLIFYPGLDKSFLNYFKSVGIKITNTNQLREVLSESAVYEEPLSRYNEFIRSHVGTGNSFEHQTEKILSIFNQDI